MGNPESMGGRGGGRSPEILDGEPRSGSLAADDEADAIIKQVVADRTGDSALLLHVLLLRAEGCTDAASERALVELGITRMRVIAEDMLQLGAIEVVRPSWRILTPADAVAAWRLLPS